MVLLYQKIKHLSTLFSKFFSRKFYETIFNDWQYDPSQSAYRYEQYSVVCHLGSIPLPALLGSVWLCESWRGTYGCGQVRGVSVRFGVARMGVDWCGVYWCV